MQVVPISLARFSKCEQTCKTLTFIQSSTVIWFLTNEITVTLFLTNEIASPWISEPLAIVNLSLEPIRFIKPRENSVLYAQFFI